MWYAGKLQMQSRDLNDPAYVPRRTLSVREGADWLGVKDSKVYNLFNQGHLDGYRVGDAIRIYAESVEAFKQTNANKKPAKPEAQTPRTRPARKRSIPLETQGLRFFRL